MVAQLFFAKIIIDNVRFFIIGAIQFLNFQFATEYGKCTQSCDEKRFKPFQDLNFLVRNWQNDGEYEYGSEGGKKFLSKVLEISDNQLPDLKIVRKSLRDSFHKIDCYLMPFPGVHVATGKDNFDGRLRDIDIDFQNHLKIFIPSILAARNLKPKKVVDIEFTVSQFVYYFEQFEKVFNADNLPVVRTFYNVVVTNHYDRLMSKCVQIYRKNMTDSLRSSESRNDEFIQSLHREKRLQAEQEFLRAPQMGSREDTIRYHNKLDEMLNEIFRGIRQKVAQLNPKYLEWLNLFFNMLNLVLLFVPWGRLPSAVQGFAKFCGFMRAV